jgi:hypothetical protein
LLVAEYFYASQDSTVEITLGAKKRMRFLSFFRTQTWDAWVWESWQLEKKMEETELTLCEQMNDAYCLHGGADSETGRQ